MKIMKIKLYWSIAIGLIFALLLGCAASQIVGGLVSSTGLKDGLYEGKASEGPVSVVAQVRIQDQKITAIELVSHRTWKGKAAEGVIPERIIAAQSTKVDVVSDASISSRTIKNAVEKAVQNLYYLRNVSIRF